MKILLNLEIQYDTSTKECKVVSCTQEGKLEKQGNKGQGNRIEHVLGKSEVRYGILTLGTNNPVGDSIPKDSRITVKYRKDGKTIYKKEVNTHKSVKGRVNGLTEMYDKHHELQEDAIIEVKYSLNDKILEIKTIYNR